MRIDNGRPLKNGGWLHRGSNFPVTKGESSGAIAGVAPKSGTSPTRNFSTLIYRWRLHKAGEMVGLAALLGVEQQDLNDLHVCFAREYNAFAFPMYDPTGEIIGIRLRGDWRKWAVKGSHQGLFIAFNAIKRLSPERVMVCEGPTDTAAAMALGFFAIGRPSCRGCEQMVVDVLRQLPVKEVIVAYDNDEPGFKGAEELIKRIPFRVARFIPPTKDLRSFLNAGATHALVDSIIANTIRT